VSEFNVFSSNTRNNSVIDFTFIDNIALVDLFVSVCTDKKGFDGVIGFEELQTTRISLLGHYN
jgi:hypothetical protein